MYDSLLQIVRENRSIILNCSGRRELTSVPIRELIEKKIISFTGGNRAINRDQVERIKSGMIFPLLGTLRLALSEDGTLNILDGQHRFIALMEIFDEIPKDETIILEIIPVEDDVEFLQLLKMTNDTVPFSEKDYDSLNKYCDVKKKIEEMYLPIVREKLNIRTLFGTNRPRINENNFSQIKKSNFFKTHSSEEIFERLAKLNSQIEEFILKGEINDHYTRKYLSLGFYLWWEEKWMLL